MEQAATEVRSKAESKRAKIEREEAEARSKVVDEIKEKSDKMRKAREEKAKSEAETAERASSWVNSKDKKKAEITRLADKAK